MFIGCNVILYHTSRKHLYKPKLFFKKPHLLKGHLPRVAMNKQRKKKG